jgi:integrase
VAWANPVTPDLVPDSPAKDPLRQDKLPLELRVRLVSGMDRWQLCAFALSTVLPLRPDEATGLLVSDINWDAGWLEFRTRFGGADFNKGKENFVLPFPEELRPILHACVDGRVEGPLLRDRAACAGRCKRSVASTDDMVRMYEDKLAKAPHGAVQTEQDRKEVFRRLLRTLGGASPDQLAKEFQRVLRAQGVGKGMSLYSLRHSVTTAMHRTPGMPHLELRYLTGHTTRDILSEYVPFDPVGVMRRYFATIQPLLVALTERAKAVGLPVRVLLPADRQAVCGPGIDPSDASSFPK